MRGQRDKQEPNLHESATSSQASLVLWLSQRFIKNVSLNKEFSKIATASEKSGRIRTTRVRRASPLLL